MTDRFNNFFPFVIAAECDWPRDKTGQYSDDPSDPGGPTRFGVDKRSHPNVDVVSLTYPKAEQIYFHEWQQEGCEHAAPLIGEAFFDACVNCGLGRATQFLHAAEDWQGQIAAREAFYRRLAQARPVLARYLAGWLDRARDLRAYLRNL